MTAPLPLTQFVESLINVVHHQTLIVERCMMLTAPNKVLGECPAAERSYDRIGLLNLNRRSQESGGEISASCQKGPRVAVSAVFPLAARPDYERRAP